jgi:hypothetical protein
MKKIFAVIAINMALSGGILGFQTLPLQIATASILPSAMAGMPYRVAIAAAGGVGPYLWFQGSPGFPAGLGMEGGTGVISGFAGASGTYTFVPGVLDSSGSPLDGGLDTGAAQQEKQFTIVVQ